MSDQEEEKRGDNPSPQIFSEIIVKFREGGEIEKKRGRLYAQHLSLEQFYKTVKSIEGAQVRRSFHVEKERLREMNIKARKGRERPIPSLDLFVRVRLPPALDAEEIAEQFADDPEVEYACVAGIPGPPPSPNFTGMQDYQDSAPDGVDAPFAWFFPGGDGNGVDVCDCEYGFNPNHEDLPAVNVVSNRDGNLASYSDHGTAVMGELAGKPDTQGVTGICHGATALFASESGGFRTDCIMDAIGSLGSGDILVLEMQDYPTPFKPAEYNPDVHAAVSMAVGLGITVVAAAGNGPNNLTATTNALGKYIWNPSSPDYDDSGAILVGAGASASSTYPHSKRSSSNYGVRVNCQGWGGDVVTTGYGDLHNGGQNALYTDTFNGTSSATPIVAGVAACLQGAAIQALGAPLTPLQVRTLLSDPANGTPQADSPTYPAATYPIDPLPDLRRVLRAAGIYPDVYMRDSISDTGTEPYTGGVLCWSPDIIAKKTPVANPSTEFGINTWSNADLGEKIEFGQDNYVYVRMHNRGTAPDDVTVSVYWSKASGFIHPSSWNLLGTLSVGNIQPGEYRVSGPLVWPASQVPSVGHYCFIGVINSERDPITIPGSFSTGNGFLDFVRNHNNVCWRNTDVEDAIPGSPAPPYGFVLRGLPERSARFKLEVRHRLPKGSKFKLTIGRELRRFERTKPGRGLSPTHAAFTTGFVVKNYRPLVLTGIQLKRNQEVSVKIDVELPKGTPPGRYLVYADQYLGRLHLGRVNYVLRVKKD
jgi:hypothetical protein